ncbi:unnamed protein product [Amoebophrya sp. A25]|nr:unnamed protein product [Amoebophrya sp. A25]|eukprot:GSA25T00025722001.1
MMTMMDASSLGMPKKGGTRDKLMKCCIGRDIGLQVCGRTKKDIEEEYNKCVDKKCLGDKNCKMNAQFGIMMSGGVSGDKCDEYTKFQKANCDCVDGDSKDDTFKKSLTNFYTTFAKEKLPEKEMDDQWMSETVYKSFKKGQESKIWHALLNKYSKNLRHETKDKPRYDDYLGKGGLKDDYLNDDYLGRGGKDDYLGKDDSYGDDDYLSGMYDDLGRKRKDASGSTKGSTKGTTTSGSSSSGNKNTKGAAGAKGSEKTSSQKDEKPSSSKSASPEDKEESSKKTASSTSREKKEEEPSRRTVETIDDEPAGFGGSGDEDVKFQLCIRHIIMS